MCITVLYKFCFILLMIQLPPKMLLTSKVTQEYVYQGCGQISDTLGKFSIFLIFIYLAVEQLPDLLSAQLIFSGPWENISTLWQYLFSQLYKTLLNLTLPDQFSIHFPSLAEGYLTPASNPDSF